MTRLDQIDTCLPGVLVPRAMLADAAAIAARVAEATTVGDPNDPDTDDDGKSDGVEVHVLGTNPLVADNFDSQPRSGGGAPGVPMLLLLLMIGLARRARRQAA